MIENINFKSLAQKFGELDIVTQKIIIGIGAFLAVLGPLALLIGGLGGAFVAGLTAMAPFLIALAKFVLIAAAIVIAVDKITMDYVSNTPFRPKGARCDRECKYWEIL